MVQQVARLLEEGDGRVWGTAMRTGAEPRRLPHAGADILEGESASPFRHGSFRPSLTSRVFTPAGRLPSAAGPWRWS